MAKYSELSEERKEQIRKYQREYKKKKKNNWNKRNPEKLKKIRERWKEQHPGMYEKQRKKNRLNSFFKFYNACENKGRAFITIDISEVLRISRVYATEIATEAKKENLITPIGKQGNNIMYHFNKERIENMSNNNGGNGHSQIVITEVEPINGKPEQLKLQEKTKQTSLGIEIFDPNALKNRIIMGQYNGIMDVVNSEIKKAREERSKRDTETINVMTRQINELQKTINSVREQNKSLMEEKTELETYLKNASKNSANKELAQKEEIQRLKETCQRATEEARKLKDENTLLQVDSDKIVKQSEENQRLSSLIKERDGKLLELAKSHEEKKKSNQLLKDKISEISRDNNLLKDAISKSSSLEKENTDLLEQLREERRKNQALADKMRKYFEDDLMGA